ncbi:cobalamin biosynthesis protein [Marinobacter salinexigens]|uniref:Cobalamin biosynthesis protein CobD n=1 Tax=Marinobacter salinexigens TaxID=2919747 RepID=A0A5B0VKJ1_9GAMM|nr:adenosylcobinamide-phosphate synthase CbiB [Marinobacter salinexigens]KAA1174511.1 cobalamin biosynthesis protein [Marinobacter salinexigens]
MSVLVCFAALLLDQWVGEPSRWHPVVGFGRMAAALEQRLNRPQGQGIARGLLALLILVVPVLLILLWLNSWMPEPLWWVVELLAVWTALSLRGLAEHGGAVAEALNKGDLPLAREQVSRIVSRNAQALDEPGVAAAATESMLENGADAVFASLFWFLVAGVPGVVLHRMVNTLDAMWGYRNNRYLRFGRVAARLDDALNWIPARLTAATYTLLGNSSLAWRCWRTQARSWDSPNAGPVMAAGAGALGVTLGGPAPYAGGIKQRPTLGQGAAPDARSIQGAITLVRQGAWLWLMSLLAGVGLWVAFVGGGL